MLSHLLRRTRGVQFQRRRLETADHDFVDVDLATVDRYGWLWTALGDTAPLVLVLHGLEGSARRGYMVEMYRQLAQQGIRSMGLNFRSCSGEMNRTTMTYHAGFTADVTLVLDWLHAQFPDVPLGLVGFSLGANVTLKYMGEGGQHVQAATAVSPPFDLAMGSAVLAGGSGRLYTPRLMHSLKEKMRLKEAQLRGHIDYDRLIATQTLYEFDELWQPINGFANAADYYAQCSSQQFLPHIDKPTLILRALDDPFFDPGDVPYETLSANPYLRPILTRHGGHVGFLDRHGFWAERTAASFLSQQLQSEKSVMLYEGKSKS